jgi:hypothetical protein
MGSLLVCSAYLVMLAVFAVPVEYFIRAQEKGKQKDTEWVFQPERRLVLHLYGAIDNTEGCAVGYLDGHGEFVPDRDIPSFPGLCPAWYWYSKKYPLYNASRGPFIEPVYEYRAGMLIPGTMGSSSFLATPGDVKIIPFEDYVYVPDTAPESSWRIYNLPGRFVKKSERQNKQAKPTLENGWIFQHEKRLVLRQYAGPDNLYGLGYLADCGEFVPDPKVLPFRNDSPAWEKHKHYPVYNEQVGPKSEEVYEYRSGYLVPGSLGGWFFYPDEGGKIVPFADYDPGTARRRIYNLPGKFVKRNDIRKNDP